MTNLLRSRRRRALQFDHLEHKALLSTVTVYPFGHPDAARKIQIADTGGSTTGLPMDGTSGNSGTGASAGVGASAGTGSTSGTGGNTGTGSTSTGNGGTSTGTNGGSSGFAGTEENAHFRYHGGHAEFSLTQRGGGYKFSHNYSGDIQRDRHTPLDGSFTASDAVVAFQNMFYARAAGTFPGLAGLSTGTSGGFTVQHERFRGHGGEASYDLTIRAAGYRFTQHYDVQVRRDHHAANTGSVTAADAITAFFHEFDARASQAVAGNGSGSGSGGTTGTRA